MEPVHLCDVDCGFAAGVNAAELGSLDPLKLALATKIGFELGEDTQHVEEGFAGCSRGIDRLFRRTQGHAALFQIMDDILQGNGKASTSAVVMPLSTGSSLIACSQANPKRVITLKTSQPEEAANWRKKQKP